MNRLAILFSTSVAALSLLMVQGVPAQSLPTPGGSADPAFKLVPFEQWFAGGEQAHIRWTTEIPDPTLSPHQRFTTRVKFKVNGEDLATRRGKGQLAMMIQFRDEKGAIWQAHDGLDLGKLNESVRANDIEYLQPLFILPGDYEVSLALFDTATGEHATARRKLHVSGLRGDPLTDAWRDLPAVEFIRTAEAPDAWYLPDIKGSLRLAARPRRPMTIDLLVNLTPTERMSGTNRGRDRNLSLLLPALKIFAQTDWGDAALRVSFLDIANRTVAFQQDKVQALDWERAKGSLTENAPGIVDVKSLENRKHNASFFVREVGRRIDGPGQAKSANDPYRVVVVLTSPVSFESGVERHPIEVAARDGFRVFYIRYHPYSPSIVINPARTGLGRGYPMDDVVIRPPPAGSQDDQLAPLLKSVRPELFDITTTDQFRRVLATILAEVASL
jgi:hypothetical protein